MERRADTSIESFGFFSLLFCHGNARAAERSVSISGLFMLRAPCGDFPVRELPDDKNESEVNN